MFFVFFKQKTAYEMRISDWSSDVCSSDLEIYENVWDALADTEQEAANLKLRSSLLYEIRKVVQGWNVSQDEAGKRLGLTRPRTNDLLRGKLAKFSLDALVNIAASAHLHVELTL